MIHMIKKKKKKSSDSGQVQELNWKWRKAANVQRKTKSLQKAWKAISEDNLKISLTLRKLNINKGRVAQDSCTVL